LTACRQVGSQIEREGCREEEGGGDGGGGGGGERELWSKTRETEVIEDVNAWRIIVS
jgi:hypothetical protein